MNSSKTNYFKTVNHQMGFGDFRKVTKGTGPKVMRSLKSMRPLPNQQVLVFFIKLNDGMICLVNPSYCCSQPQDNGFGQCAVYGNYKNKYLKGNTENLTMHQLNAPKAMQGHPDMALWTSDPHGQGGPTGIHFTASKTGTLWIQGDTLTPQILAGSLRADYPILGQQSWGPLCKGYKIKKINVYTARYNARSSSVRSMSSHNLVGSRPSTPRRSDSSHSLYEDHSGYTMSPAPVYVSEPSTPYIEGQSPVFVDPTYAMAAQPAISQPIYTGDTSAYPMVQTIPVGGDPAYGMVQPVSADAWPVYYENGSTAPVAGPVTDPNNMHIPMAAAW